MLNTKMNSVGPASVKLYFYISNIRRTFTVTNNFRSVNSIMYPFYNGSALRKWFTRIWLTLLLPPYNCIYLAKCEAVLLHLWSLIHPPCNGWVGRFIERVYRLWSASQTLLIHWRRSFLAKYFLWFHYLSCRLTPNRVLIIYWLINFIMLIYFS